MLYEVITPYFRVWTTRLFASRRMIIETFRLRDKIPRSLAERCPRNRRATAGGVLGFETRRSFTRMLFDHSRFSAMPRRTSSFVWADPAYWITSESEIRGLFTSARATRLLGSRITSYNVCYTKLLRQVARRIAVIRIIVLFMPGTQRSIESIRRLLFPSRA